MAISIGEPSCRDGGGVGELSAAGWDSDSAGGVAALFETGMAVGAVAVPFLNFIEDAFNF